MFGYYWFAVNLHDQLGVIQFPGPLEELLEWTQQTKNLRPVTVGVVLAVAVQVT